MDALHVVRVDEDLAVGDDGPWIGETSGIEHECAVRFRCAVFVALVPVGAHGGGDERLQAAQDAVLVEAFRRAAPRGERPLRPLGGDVPVAPVRVEARGEAGDEGLDESWMPAEGIDDVPLRHDQTGLAGEAAGGPDQGDVPHVHIGDDGEAGVPVDDGAALRMGVDDRRYPARRTRPPLRGRDEREPMHPAILAVPRQVFVIVDPQPEVFEGVDGVGQRRIAARPPHDGVGDAVAGSALDEQEGRMLPA
ncbi:hypothetical protein AIIKEEIJ_02175 [Rhodococcus sp. YH1]|nr:hypothetical protein [Rhodococcus sp. YH1]